MRKLLLLAAFIIPLLCNAQGKRSSSAKTCAPTVNGKICYVDKVNMTNVSQEELFSVINKWAKRKYGNIFVSNIASDKAKGTIFVSSKVELLMSKREKTFMKFKMYITCTNENYVIVVTDIAYQYENPDGKKRTYLAEEVIINEGKENKVSVIKDPLLFCNATRDFVDNLFGDIFYVTWEGN